MIVSRYTPLTVLKIRSPRYHDRKLLVAKFKVRHSNKIIIEQGAYQGEYFMHGSKIATYPLGSNGKIPVYEIPLDDLEVLEYKETIAKTVEELFDE